MNKHQKQLAEKIIHLHKENVNQPGFFTWNPMPELFTDEREMFIIKRRLKKEYHLIKDYTDQTTLLTKEGCNFKDFDSNGNLRRIKVKVYWLLTISYLLGVLTPLLLKRPQQKNGKKKSYCGGIPHFNNNQAPNK